MVKILGAVMTGFACGYLGFKISFAMKIRAESLNNIITSLEMLESEINFSMNKLKQAFMRVDKCGLFKFAAENMDEKGVKTAWTNAVNECSTKLSLKDADKDILMTLGKNIGRTDTDDQIKNIKYNKKYDSRAGKTGTERIPPFRKNVQKRRCTCRTVDCYYADIMEI